jgi:peptide/nickel transport system permease protein
MVTYAVKRVGLALLIVLCVSVVLFALLRFIPGDPVSIALGPRATQAAVERYVEKMRLDEPIYVQFFYYLVHLAQGDLGTAVFSERSIVEVVLNVLPFTIVLAVAALGWAVLLGVPLGCVSAIRPNTALDRITGILSVGAIAIPSFLVSIWSILVFAIALRWLPAIGAGDPGDAADQTLHLILPAFAVGLGWVGYLARMVRASMLEVMGETYIRAARAFGLAERAVVFRYALRIAVLPSVTLIGIGFGGLLSGAVFAEIIFARPGLGSLIYEAVNDRDIPTVQGGVLVATVLYVIVTLVADLVVAWLDPRLRESL